MKCPVCQFENPLAQDAETLLFEMVREHCLNKDQELVSYNEITAWALRTLAKLDRVELTHVNGREIRAKIIGAQHESSV